MLRGKISVLIIMDDLPPDNDYKDLFRMIKGSSRISCVYFLYRKQSDWVMCSNLFTVLVPTVKAIDVSEKTAYKILLNVLSDPECIENDILVMSSNVYMPAQSVDVMSRALHSFDRYCAVVPLSNTGFITFCNGSSNVLSASRIISCIKDKTPEKDIVPYLDKNAILLNRRIFENFHTLLENNSTSDIFDILNEYAILVSGYGYNGILSYRSFAYNKRIDQDQTKDVLAKKYPFFRSAFNDYIRYKTDPVIRFSELFLNGKQKKKVLLNIGRIDPVYNGTSEYIMSLLSCMYEKMSEKYLFSILVNKRADAFFGLSRKYRNVIVNDDFSVQEKFHLVYTPYQVFQYEDMIMINRIGLKHIVEILDLIKIRCDYLRTMDLEIVIGSVVRYNDGVIVLTDYVKEDILNYFQNVNALYRTIFLSKVIPPKTRKKKKMDLPDKFVFLIGNRFIHKAVDITLKNVPNDIFVVVLSDRNAVEKNIIYLRSGSLPDAVIHEIYSRCSVMLFPSQYEGFGLPILSSALYGKQIIVYDSKINREIVRKYRLNGNIHYFVKFAQLHDIIRKIMANNPSAGKLFSRTWSDVSSETIDFIDSVMKKKVDIARLYMRNREINVIHKLYSDRLTHAWMSWYVLKHRIEQKLFPTESIRRRIVRKLLRL